MAELVKNDLPWLVKRLRHREPLVRQCAATTLGKYGHEAEIAVNILSELVRDAHVDVATAATRTLGRIGVPALAALVGALRSPAKQVRREAAWALKEFGPAAAEAAPALTAALQDADLRVRMAVAHALGAIGPAAQSAIPRLIDALKNSNIIFCRLAAEALSRIGPAALPALRQESHSPDRHVRREAAWAIRQISPALEPYDAAPLNPKSVPAAHVATVPIPTTYHARSADAG